MAQFQELEALTQCGVPSVPGKNPGDMMPRPTPAGQHSRVVSLISFVYTRSDRRFVYNRRVNPYSHQRPPSGECLGGRNTPLEQLRWRLRG